MKKEKRLINERNFMETAADMTDEDIYIVSRAIVENLFSKNQILTQVGWTSEDILNHQFTYFYDKQSRGLESPLTLKNKITKKHLRNLLYREFSLAIAYHTREGRTQNEYNRNVVSLNDDRIYDTSSNISDKIYAKLNEIEDYSLESVKDVDNEMYNEYIFSKLTEDLIESDLKLKINKHYKLKTNRKIILKDDQINYDDSECIYKDLTYRDLAKYYCHNYNNKKVTSTELEDIIVEVDDEGNINKPSNKIIKKIMDSFKIEVSNKIFNKLEGDLA